MVALYVYFVCDCVCVCVWGGGGGVIFGKELKKRGIHFFILFFLRFFFLVVVGVGGGGGGGGGELICEMTIMNWHQLIYQLIFKGFYWLLIYSYRPTALVVCFII